MSRLDAGVFENFNCPIDLKMIWIMSSVSAHTIAYNL